jgi:hypothetical protein
MVEKWSKCQKQKILRLKHFIWLECDFGEEILSRTFRASRKMGPNRTSSCHKSKNACFQNFHFSTF